MRTRKCCLMKHFPSSYFQIHVLKEGVPSQRPKGPRGFNLPRGRNWKRKEWQISLWWGRFSAAFIALWPDISRHKISPTPRAIHVMTERTILSTFWWTEGKTNVCLKTTISAYQQLFCLPTLLSFRVPLLRFATRSPRYHLQCSHVSVLQIVSEPGVFCRPA